MLSTVDGKKWIVIDRFQIPSSKTPISTTMTILQSWNSLTPYTTNFESDLYNGELYISAHSDGKTSTDIERAINSLGNRVTAPMDCFYGQGKVPNYKTELLVSGGGIVILIR